MNTDYNNSSWRSRMYTIIFESDTRSGRIFDIVLITVILISVLVVLLDSITSLNQKYGPVFYSLEWCFTLLFTIEYILRIYAVRKKIRYIFSFFGIIDLLAVLPAYFSLIYPGSQLLLVIRLMRVLRIFRVLKMMQYVREAGLIMQALKASSRKIIVFFFFIITIVCIMGSVMYLVEGSENGFTNIPRSIYWAIVTLTTVGYGDISPKTPLGQTIASVIMIIGYAIIAVPTGIVTSEMNRLSLSKKNRICRKCGTAGHSDDAKYCAYCGSIL